MKLLALVLLLTMTAHYTWLMRIEVRRFFNRHRNRKYGRKGLRGLVIVFLFLAVQAAPAAYYGSEFLRALAEVTSLVDFTTIWAQPSVAMTKPSLQPGQAYASKRHVSVKKHSGTTIRVKRKFCHKAPITRRHPVQSLEQMKGGRVPPGRALGASARSQPLRKSCGPVSAHAGDAPSRTIPAYRR